MFKLLPPSTKIYWEMCFMSSAGSYQKQWITIHNRCRAVWKKYCWLFTKERNILYILRTIKLHCATFCPFLVWSAWYQKKGTDKDSKRKLWCKLYSFGFCYLLILLAIFHIIFPTFGQSHNDQLCFYWCKIPLDGSNQFWFINHGTWVIILTGERGPSGQMLPFDQDAKYH